jgi:hypothetical protein
LIAASSSSADCVRLRITCTLAAAACTEGVRSHGRFRNKGTKFLRGSGIKWLRGGAKRELEQVPPAWSAAGRPRKARSPPAGPISRGRVYH